MKNLLLSAFFVLAVSGTAFAQCQPGNNGNGWDNENGNGNGNGWGQGGNSAQAQAQPQSHVLPDIPFHTDRWDSVNADVKLRAKSIVRAKALPLENLDVHLKMRDQVLSLEPLDFGFAGGKLSEGC